MKRTSPALLALHMLGLAAVSEQVGSSAQKLADSMDALKVKGARAFGFGGAGDVIYGPTHSQIVKRKRLNAHNERQRRKKR